MLRFGVLSRKKGCLRSSVAEPVCRWFCCSLRKAIDCIVFTWNGIKSLPPNYTTYYLTSTEQYRGLAWCPAVSLALHYLHHLPPCLV